MPRKAKVSRDFKSFLPDQQFAFGLHVVTEMNDHALVFATPKIPMADFALINSTYGNKIDAAKTGDKSKIDDRDAYTPIWEDAFEQQAVYVDSIANGSNTIIEQSGYHATKTEFKKKINPNQPVIEAYGNRQHGSVHFKSNALGNADGYIAMAMENMQQGQVQFSITGNQLSITVNGITIYLVPTTKRQGNFEGLKTGNSIFVGMLAFNSAGISPVSDPAIVVVP